MNKIPHIVCLLITLFLTACGNSSNEEIPSVSTSFLKKHFANASVVETQKTLDFDYEVTLDNGVDITFERRGNWEEINARKNDISAVFEQILPYNLFTYVKTNYPDKKIRKVERKKYGYLVTLNKPESIKLEFNKSGSFISKRADD